MLSSLPVGAPSSRTTRTGLAIGRSWQSVVGCDLMEANEMKTVRSVICLFAVAVPAIGLSTSSPAWAATICCSGEDASCRIVQDCTACRRGQACAENAGCGEIGMCCLYDGCERICVQAARDCCTALGGIVPPRPSCLRCPHVCRSSDGELIESEQVPTVSAWGVVTLVLILVGGLAIKFRGQGVVRG